MKTHCTDSQNTAAMARKTASKQESTSTSNDVFTLANQVSFTPNGKTASRFNILAKGSKMLEASKNPGNCATSQIDPEGVAQPHCTDSQNLVFSGNIVMNSFTRFFFVLTALFVLFAAVPAFAQSSDEDTADRSDRSSTSDRTDADRTGDETPSKPKADKPQDETSDDERRILKDQKESSDTATEIDKLKNIGKNLPDIKEVKPKRPIDPDKITDFSAIQSVNKSGVSPQVLTRPKGSGSVSGMGLTFQTNLQTGSASLSIPVSIPPARSGTGPSIGLGYSSGAGQGVAGIGWSFGVSYIARQTDQGLPLYDDRLDHFIYGGGHEMVRVAMPSGEEPDFLAGHTYYYYRAKLEGIFMRIFLVNPNTPDSYFVVQDKNGTLYWFGADSDGNRVTSSRVCGNVECEDTFRWNLVQMRDVHGNIVKYTYLKDEEQSYLSKVEYNVHPSDETRFQHAIEMQYGSRSDVLTTYQTGYAVTTALRLVNIRVKSDYGSGGHTLVRRYSFQYMPNSFHSLLKSVTMYGKDDTTHLPPAEFEYSEVDSYYQLEDMGRIAVGITEMDYSPSASLGDGRRDLLDVDADGLPDIYETDPLIPGYIQKYQKNTGGEFQSYREEMPGGNSLLLYNTNIRLMDVDGDGKSEMIHMPKIGSYSVYKSTCDDGAFTITERMCEWELIGTFPANPGIDFTTDAENIRLVDVNGDHLIDVVRTTGTSMQHWLNLGKFEGQMGRFGHVTYSFNSNGTVTANFSDQPLTSCVLHKGLPISFSDAGVKFADVNGDGLQDIVHITNSSFVYWPNRGHGLWGEGGECAGGTFGANRHIEMDLPESAKSLTPEKFHLGDLNGDGLADLMLIQTDYISIWLNRGTGFTERAFIFNTPASPAFGDNVRIADMNGSGSQDILWGDGQNFRYLDLTGGIKPRLLVSVKNGLGGVTDISYRSSTEEYLEADASGEPWETMCPFPSQVVKQVTTRDQFNLVPGFTENAVSKRYHYANCFYDGIRHVHRGFGRVVEENIGDDQDENGNPVTTPAIAPTTYTEHHYYQAKEDRDGTKFDGIASDEAFAGAEYFNATWANKSTGRVYAGNSFTTYAVRHLMDAHPMDTPTNLQAVFKRAVRFVYGRETHGFAYDTSGTDVTAGPTATVSPEVYTKSITSLYNEEAGTTENANIDYFYPEERTIHTKAINVVDGFGQTLQKTVFGRLDSNDNPLDDPVTTYATYAYNPNKWIHRLCESYLMQASGDTKYNHIRHYYDGNTSGNFGETCTVGDKGLSTMGKFMVYNMDSTSKEIEAHKTTFNRWGLPIHTKQLKKMENWLFYEDPSGYQALPTREVALTGVSANYPYYPNTPVRTFTTRASYDVGLGVITEYRDMDGQKSQAVYDALGRITALWVPHVPTASCPAPVVPNAEIEYDLATSSRPYSFVRTTTYENLCDASSGKTAIAYADGMGRARLAVAKIETGPDKYLASGHADYNCKGMKVASYSPFYTTGYDLVPTSERNCTHSRNTPVDVDGSGAGSDIVCKTKVDFDAFGRTYHQTNPDGTETWVAFKGPFRTEMYDEKDSANLISSTPRIIEKDPHGRLKSITDKSSVSSDQDHVTEYTWDALGNLTLMRRKSGVDGSGENTFITKIQEFNSIGEKTRIEDPDTGEWLFTYDDSGNLQSHTDPNQNVISYVYDDSNRMIMEFCTAGPGVNSDCNPEVPAVKYVYDTAYRMEGGKGYMPEEAVDHQGNPVEHQNLLGNLSYVIGQNTENYFSYDQRGRQIAEARRFRDLETPANWTSYYVSQVEYDDLDRVTKQIYPGDEAVSVCNTYNYRGLLATMTDCNETSPLAYVSLINYDKFGRRKMYQLGDEKQTSVDLKYNIRGLLYSAHRTQENTLDPSNPWDVSFREYHYDEVGNIYEIIDNRTNPLWIDSEPDRIFNIAMTYDGFNQLLSTSYTYSDPGKLYDGRMFRYMEYDYDILGNLVKKITTRHLDTDSVPVDNPPDEFYKTWFGTATYGTGTAGPDAMSSAGDSAGNTIAIGYDGAGNMTTLTINKSGEITEYNYEWDEFNRLKQASRTGGPVGTPDYDATYFYDYGSVRVGKVEEKDSVTEHTLYINEAVEERWNGTSYNLVRYIFDGSRLARLDISGTTTTRRWMHPDHLGTTGCITKDGDPEGQAETITLYLPYGAVLEEKSETGFRDPYGFTGKELEVDLGIMYFGARWYNPQLGRWLSPDPLYLVSTAKNAERQQNLYEYASNNPWKFVDPNGLDEDKANSNMSSVHGMDKNSKIVISTQYDEQFNAINKHLVGLGYTNIERLGYNRVEIKNKDGKGTGVYNYNKASKAGKDKLVSTQLQAAEGLIFMGHHGPEEGIGVFYNGSSNDKLRIDFNKLKLPNLKVIVSDVCRVHQELKCKKQKKLLVGYDIIKKSAPNLKLSLMMYSRAARYSISKDSQKNGSFGTMLVRSFFNPHFTGSPWKWCLKAITSISGSPKGYWGGDNNVERSVVLRNLSPGEKFFSFNYKNKQMEFYPNLYPSQLPRPLGSWWSK